MAAVAEQKKDKDKERKDAKKEKGKESEMERKKGEELLGEGQQFVEERIIKANGEPTIRKYVKGRFLGKVRDGREA